MPYINRYKNEYSKTPRKRKSISEKGYRELERILDKVFSEYIRLRDADDNGWARCITCGSVHRWNDGDTHNGHYINRDVKAVRFNEVNCNAQCKSCNSFRSGRIHIYRQKLIEKYGEDEVKEIERLADTGGNYDCYWLQLKIKEYREKVRRLKSEKDYV